MKEAYLGDGVYISYDGFHLILKTGNGAEARNEIYLDQYVLSNLLSYIEKIKEGK